MKKLTFLLLWGALLLTTASAYAQKIGVLGVNTYGQFGNGATSTTENWTNINVIGTDCDWIAIGRGNYHSFAIKTNGTLWAWGRNNEGQLGDGTTTDKTVPTKIGTDTDWKQVTGGLNFSLAIKTDGTLWAWGNNSKGQLGDGSTYNQTTPFQVGCDADWAQVACGDELSLALKTDGTLWTWGYNSGAYCDGTITNKTTPTQIGIETDWRKIANTGDIYAIKNNGTLWKGSLGGLTQYGTGTNWEKVFGNPSGFTAIRNDGTGIPVAGGDNGLSFLKTLDTDKTDETYSTKSANITDAICPNGQYFNPVQRRCFFCPIKGFYWGYNHDLVEAAHCSYYPTFTINETGEIYYSHANTCTSALEILHYQVSSTLLLGSIVAGNEHVLVLEKYIFSGGYGTQTFPYRISALDDLKYLSEHSEYWDKYFIQTADIDASATSTWNDNGAGGYYGFSPIGNATTKFSGNYNGDGHTITGLYINRPSTNYVGLFGYTWGCKIDNLGVVDCAISGGTYSTGGLVGYLEFESTVMNSFCTGNVTAGDGVDVGGFVGYTGDMGVKVNNCYSMCSVTRTGTSNDGVGGFVGQNNGELKYCYSSGSVTATGDYVGGLIGSYDGGSILKCYWNTDSIASGMGDGTMNGNVIGLTTAQMKTQVNFTDWDFTGETTNGTDDYWSIDATKNDGYPYLSWQTLEASAQPMQLVFTTTAASQSIELPLYGTVDCTVDWGDGSATEDFTTEGNKPHTFATAGTYTVSISGSLTHFGYYVYALDEGWAGAGYLTEVVSFGDIGLTSLFGAFVDADNLTSVPTSLPAEITNLQDIFRYVNRTSIINLNLWDVSHVTNMSRMFFQSDFNQDISGWNVSSANDMNNMFFQSDFDQNIGSWQIGAVTNMVNMFEYVTLSTANYDALLIGWAAQTVQSGVTFHGGNSKYSAGAAATARGVLTGGTNLWTITDGGMNIVTCTWVGSSSNDWNTAGNWDLNVVPTSATDVIIPAIVSPAVYPVIASGTQAEAKNLLITAAGEDILTIEQGGKLTVHEQYQAASGAKVKVMGQ